MIDRAAKSTFTPCVQTLCAAIALIYLQTSSLQAQFMPISLGPNSLNHDIVVEAEAAHPPGTNAISASMDGGTAKTGFTWHEVGYLNSAPASGLPPAGSSITNNSGTHIYTFTPDYTTNNAILIDTNTSAFFDFPGFALYRALSFLTAAGNGDVSVAYTITHVDGTTQEGTFTSPDWFNGADPAYTANARVSAQTGEADSVGTGNPRLYSVEIGLTNTLAIISSLSLRFQSGRDTGHAAILAVSGLRNLPSFLASATTVTVFAGNDAVLRQAVVGPGPFSYQWRFFTNGSFSPVLDAPFVAGATTNELRLAHVNFSQAGRYLLVVSNQFDSVGQEVELKVFSNGADVTSPIDIIEPDGVTSQTLPDMPRVIDNTTTQFTANLDRDPGSLAPLTLFITPGRPSVVKALRLYTANDTAENDPIDFTMAGGENPSQFTVIAEGSLSLPLARNSPGLPLDPTTQNVQEVRFENTNSYRIYRLRFSRVRNGGDILQIGEVELLEHSDEDVFGVPRFLHGPSSTTVFAGADAVFQAEVVGVAPLFYRWMFVSNGITSPLLNGPSVLGADTNELRLTRVNFAQAGHYALVVSNAFGVVESPVPAELGVLFRGADITSPNDIIEPDGVTSEALPGIHLAIDNTTRQFTATFDREPGSLNPLSLFVTPARRSAVVTVLRVYTGNDTPDHDPIDYALEGIRGTQTTFISRGFLSLPLDRNQPGLPLDPTTQHLQEVRFENTESYPTYRLSFFSTRNTGQILQVGEIELVEEIKLIEEGGDPPLLSITGTPGAGLTITSSEIGVLEYTRELRGANTVWSDEGVINGPFTVTPTNTIGFYRVTVQPAR